MAFVVMLYRLTPEDAEWVGAWWMGYVIGGLMSLMVTFFILLFPRSLPGTLGRSLMAWFSQN